MAGFVIGRILLFVLAHHHGAAFRTHHDLVLGVFKVGHRHHAAVAASSESAASLTRFARSAPEKPGVPRARIAESTSGPAGIFFICTARICSRPRISGSGTTTWRSKRPGRRSAGSNYVRTIGGGDDDHICAGIEAVHFNEHLIECLLAFIIAAAERRRADGRPHQFRR